MRLPLDKLKSPATGRYGAHRTDCPNGASSCTHRGIDLHGAQGTPIYAPESGAVIVARQVALSGKDRPFSGYGPGVVLLRGDSGVYHLFGHVRRPRFALAPDLDAIARGRNLEDALLAFDGIRVAEGEQLAEVSGMWEYADGWHGETHWEVRPDGPLDGGERAIDPLGWLSASGVRGSDTPSSSSSSGGPSWGLALLLLSLLAYSRG